jgi:hypothetical protein
MALAWVHSEGTEALTLFPMNAGQQSETLRRPSTDAKDHPLVQAAAVACAYLEATQQTQKNQAYAVLAELARNTLKRAREGLSTDFTANNLKLGVAPAAAKEASGWMSPLWARLQTDEPQWLEGLIATALAQGLGFIPRLSKVQGSPSRYSLEAVPLPPSDANNTVEPIPAGGIRYTPATATAPAAWLSSTLRAGIVKWTVGLRWIILGAILVVTVAAFGILWLALNLGLRVTRPLSLADLASAALVIGIVATLVPVYRFLDDLFDLRVVMAPSFLTSISEDNVTLEFRRSTAGDNEVELAFVRYTSICPLCSGSIVVDSGRAAFPDRLVGRCRRSAREHVFSFDPISRVGRPLIQ